MSAGIKVFNKTDVNTKGNFPGVLSYEILAHKYFLFTDVTTKEKVPTANGEKEFDIVHKALDLAKSAVNGYGKPGLEFEFEGAKYTYQNVEYPRNEKVLSDKKTVEEIKKDSPVGFGLGDGKN